MEENSIDAILEKKKQKLKSDMLRVIQSEVQPFIHDELEKSIKTNIYGRQESIYYDRTDQMIESVDSYFENFDDTVNIVGKNNPNYMNPHHTSWTSGDVVDEELPEWLEYGHRVGNGYYEGSLSYSDAKYKIYPKVTNLIKKALKVKGYVVR